MGDCYPHLTLQPPSLRDIICDRPPFKITKAHSIPGSFLSADSYFSTFQPLLLEETRCMLKASYESIFDRPAECNVPVVQIEEDTRDVDVITFIVEDQALQPSMGKRGYRKDDVLVVTTHFESSLAHLHPHFTATVQHCRFYRGGDKTPDLYKIRVQYNLDGVAGGLDGVRNSKWNISIIDSIYTPIRIQEAILRAEKPKFMQAILTVPKDLPPDEYHDKLAKDDASSPGKYIYNSAQRKAISCCLKPADEIPISLIHGPPGTGKTRTLVAVLLALLKQPSPVIVTAPTNAAVSEVARRLLAEISQESNPHSPGDILLVGNADNVVLDGDLKNIFVDDRIECLHSSGNIFMTSVDELRLLFSGVESAYKVAHPDADKNPCVFLEEIVLQRATAILVHGECLLIHSPSSPGMKVLSRLIVHLEVLVKTLRSCVESIDTGSLNNDDILASLTRMCREPYAKPEFIPIRLYDISMSFIDNLDGNLPLFRHLRTTAKENTLPSKDDKTYFARKRVATERLIRKSKITYTTVASAGRSVFDQLFDLGPIVIVDEACQLIEAECLIVLRQNISKLILAGDPKQLGSVIVSDDCIRAGYRTSLFQRLSDQGWPTNFLNIQYRMHAQISLWPSTEFYNGKIVNGANVSGPSYNPLWHSDPRGLFQPLNLLDLPHGEEDVDESTMSKFNVAEADAVVALVMDFAAKYIMKESQVTIGVISPYAQQVRLISAKLNNSGLGHISCASVDAFQGQERDIIIFSAVRTGQSIGFLKDPCRLNVAATRARKSFMLVYHANALLTSTSKVWKSLINHMRGRKLQTDLSTIEEICPRQTVVKALINNRLLSTDDPLTSAEKLYPSALWEISFRRPALNKMQQAEPKLLNKTIIVLEHLSNGNRAKRFQPNTGVDDLRGMVHVEYIHEWRIIWTTLVRSGPAFYEQRIEIWDFVHGSELVKSTLLVCKSLEAFSPDYLSMCAEVMASDGSAFAKHIPVKFDKALKRKISWYRDHRERESVASNEPKSASYILEKSYRITLANIHQALEMDFDVQELPFELSEQEADIIAQNTSSFILGRSGTGKTTVLLFKMYHRYVSCGRLENDMDTLQLLVTANARLCAGIKEYWDKLIRKTGVKFTGPSAVKNVNEILEQQNAEFVNVDNQWQVTSAMPLFLTFKQFLLMLNDSLENGFSSAVAENLNINDDCEEEEGAGISSIILESTKHHLFSKEVTYEEFRIRYWIHFPSEITKVYSPLFLWNEIQGVIKGSADSLPTGRMDMEAYLKLEERRVSASLDHDGRSLIYSAFLTYERRKNQLGEFDLHDFAHHILAELFSRPYQGPAFHFSSIDEVQDLSEIQILLFKFVCQNTQGFLFAGDTAQTIAAGVDFRFEDIRRLYYTKFDCEEDACPPIRHLTQNYRTHSGVINIAASIVDIIWSLFPLSVDKLPRENALITGNLPIFLESKKADQMIFDMFGSASQDSFEFGAEQCIIVRTETAKLRLLNIIPNALVLTVQESKGLEFEDVLVFNFFTDSSFKSYRVLYNLIDGSSNCTVFDANKHRELCRELKNLYVAVTRSKSSLWFFDETPSQRLPIMDFWANRGLIDVRSEITQEMLEPLASKSSPEKWRKRGFEFFERANYDTARRCFLQAKDTFNEKFSSAMMLSVKAEECFARSARSDLKAYCGLCCEIGSLFAEIGEKSKAAQFLWKGKRYLQAFTLFKELNKNEQAVECAVLGKLYDKGLEVLRMSKPTDITNYSLKCWKFAFAFHNINDLEKMKMAINLFPSPAKRTMFLERYGHKELLLNMMRDAGNFKELGEYYLRKGDHLTALQYYKQGQHWSRCIDMVLMFCRTEFMEALSAAEVEPKVCKSLIADIVSLEEHVPDHVTEELTLFRTVLYAAGDSEKKNAPSRTPQFVKVFKSTRSIRIKMMVAKHLLQDDMNDVEALLSIMQELSSSLEALRQSCISLQNTGTGGEEMVKFFNAIPHSSPGHYTVANSTLKILLYTGKLSCGSMNVNLHINELAPLFIAHLNAITTSIIPERVMAAWKLIGYMELCPSMCNDQVSCPYQHDMAKAFNETSSRLKIVSDLLYFSETCRRNNTIPIPPNKVPFYFNEVLKILLPPLPATLDMKAVAELRADASIQTFLDSYKDFHRDLSAHSFNDHTLVVTISHFSERGITPYKFLDETRSHYGINQSLSKLRWAFRVERQKPKNEDSINRHPYYKSVAIGIAVLMTHSSWELVYNSLDPRLYAYILEKFVTRGLVIYQKAKNLALPESLIADHLLQHNEFSPFVATQYGLLHFELRMVFKYLMQILTDNESEYFFQRWMDNWDKSSKVRPISRAVVVTRLMKLLLILVLNDVVIDPLPQIKKISAISMLGLSSAFKEVQFATSTTHLKELIVAIFCRLKEKPVILRPIVVDATDFSLPSWAKNSRYVRKCCIISDGIDFHDVFAKNVVVSSVEAPSSAVRAQPKAEDVGNDESNHDVEAPANVDVHAEIEEIDMSSCLSARIRNAAKACLRKARATIHYRNTELSPVKRCQEMARLKFSSSAGRSFAAMYTIDCEKQAYFLSEICPQIVTMEGQIQEIMRVTSLQNKAQFASAVKNGYPDDEETEEEMRDELLLYCDRLTEMIASLLSIDRSPRWLEADPERDSLPKSAARFKPIFTHFKKAQKKLDRAEQQRKKATAPSVIVDDENNEITNTINNNNNNNRRNVSNNKKPPAKGKRGKR